MRLVPHVRLAHRPASSIPTRATRSRSTPRRRPSSNGGLFGTGPGGGEAKQILPDAHTDFTFAVVGEEFGFIACMVLIGALRLHRHARTERAPSASPIRSRRWR